MQSRPDIAVAGPRQESLPILNCGELQNFILATQGKLNELQSAVGELPLVDEDGHSECPFAAQLYEKKNEETMELQRRLALARDSYLLQVNAESIRQQRVLQAIRENAARLNLQEPKREFFEAERRQVERADRLRKLKEQLLALIKQMEWVIKRAQSRKMPGIEERELERGKKVDNRDQDWRRAPGPPPAFPPMTPPFGGSPPEIIGSPPPILRPGAASAGKGD